MLAHARASLRSAWWSLWLPLVLLLTQQGALLHELGHALDLRRGDMRTVAVVMEAVGTASTTATTPDEPAAPASGKAAHTLCALCLGFDHIGHAAVGAPGVPLAVVAPHGWTLAEAPTWRAADTPTARSRGPPPVL